MAQAIKRPIIFATRGSALALTQTHLVMQACREIFPDVEYQIKIIKTTGDKLQTAALANPDLASTKGLFTKELEQALLKKQADLAVHSLKDLPTDLPDGLCLGAVLPRADVRDVLIYRAAGKAGRGFPAHLKIAELPQSAAVATSSTRRQAQLLAARPDLTVMPIRGNVGTRIKKLFDHPEIDATLLAAAGLIRLHFQIDQNGRLIPPPPERAAPPKKPATPMPEGVMAACIDPALMLPCVGQGAIGIEIRSGDEFMGALCAQLNHAETRQCVTAERAFLQAMGGGCQSPVAALAEIQAGQLRLRAVSFRDGPARRGVETGSIDQPEALGKSVARQLGAH